MMAVCSFLGHRHIYGHDVQLRLQAAVNHLVEENDSVEFLLYLWKSTEPFYALCLLAALRAKQCAPQKVTLTLVADRLELEQRLADKWTHPLFFIADRLLPLSVSKDRNPLKVLKRTVQWMVKQSTHVINGFYEDLFDRDDFVLNSARNAGVQIINVTAPELEQVILASSEQLPERQRLVFQMRKSGYTQKEIAMHLNLTVSRVQQIEAAVTKNLQKQLDSISSCIPKIPQKLSVCSIFALGDANYKNLCVFSNCIRFLMTRYQIDQFCLEAETVHSGFMFALQQSIPLYHKIPTRAVAWDAGSSELYDLKAEFCPPCDAAESIGGIPAVDCRISTILELMDRSMFCICDLSASAYAQQILAHIPQTRQAVLLDIGKNTALPKSEVLGEWSNSLQLSSIFPEGYILKSTHNRRECPVYGHRGGSRGRFYYRITTFEGRPWDAKDPHKTTFMTLKHAIRLSIWRKQKETPGVEKAPGVSSPQRKESGRSGRDDGELRFGYDPAIHARRLRVYHRPRRLRMALRISIILYSRRFSPANLMG